MKKGICCGLICALGMSLSFAVNAQSLSADMQALNSNYNQFQSADNAKSALQALAIMHIASVDSQKNLPHTLHGLKQNDPQVLAYQAAYQPLIASIEQAKTLVEVGQLEQAQQLMEKVEMIKKQGHQRFK